MASFYYYYYQIPSWFCFPVQIRAFAIETSLGLPNLNTKKKKINEMSSDLSVYTIVKCVIVQMAC